MQKVSAMYRKTILVICAVFTVIDAATFEEWFEVNEDALKTSEYKIANIHNVFCASLTMTTGSGFQVEQIGLLPKWFFGLECMRKCNRNNCMDNLSAIVVDCMFDESNNAETKSTADLLWSATCDCPSETVYAGSQKTTRVVSISEMKHAYDKHGCTQTSASQISEISICGTRGRSLDDWLNTHLDIHINETAFNLKQIPNLLCSIVAESKGMNCESSVSILPKWYFSQKCMEKCNNGKCADYKDLEVNCISMPKNNEETNLGDVTIAAQCVCPECTANSGAIEIINPTSLESMLDEYRRLMCPDPTALTQTVALACNSEAAAKIINDAISCGSGPLPHCDKYADCIDDAAGSTYCKCKEGYTGNGYDCLKTCEVTVIDNAASQSTATIADVVGEEISEGESFTLACNASNSELIGEANVQCGCGGFEDLPVCRPKCPPPQVENGNFNYSAGNTEDYFSAGTVLAASCDTGRAIVGDNVIVCQENGTWSAEVPVCAKCSTPAPVSNGWHVDENGDNLTMTEYPGGSILMVVCTEPYVVQSYKSEITCQSSETWEPSKNCRLMGSRCSTVDECVDPDGVHNECNAYANRQGTYCVDSCVNRTTCFGRTFCIEDDDIYSCYCNVEGRNCQSHESCCSGVCTSNECSATPHSAGCTVDMECDTAVDSTGNFITYGRCDGGHCVQ